MIPTGDWCWGATNPAVIRCRHHRSHLGSPPLIQWTRVHVDVQTHVSALVPYVPFISCPPLNLNFSVSCHRRLPYLPPLVSHSVSSDAGAKLVPVFPQAEPSSGRHCCRSVISSLHNCAVSLNREELRVICTKILELELLKGMRFCWRSKPPPPNRNLTHLLQHYCSLLLPQFFPLMKVWRVLLVFRAFYSPKNHRMFSYVTESSCFRL